MSRNAIETIMGAVVILVAVMFLIFAYSSAQVRAVSGYSVTAKFQRIEGIREGGDVRISGIKVGTITSQILDPQTYLAVVKMNIDPSVKLPTDTVAEITSSGLLGDKYLALVPGAADEMIAAGGTIKFTQAPLSLETLIGQYIFNSSGQKAAPPAGGAAPEAAPASSGFAAPSLSKP